MAKHTGSSLFDNEQNDAQQGPVECLGMTFTNDAARRAYFLEKLREKLNDPDFRKIEGFPVGEDKDILAMSDPPYYTACPNPFLDEFVKHYSKVFSPSVIYRREPQAVDVSEGKTDAIYTAHGYHTKVPHKAIMRAVLHFTEPADLVLDGFAGSGMTGVAAQMCGCPDTEFKQRIEEEWKDAGFGQPQWGSRRVVLNDLGPAATFIAANYNVPFDVNTFEKAARKLLDELEEEIGWMYQTLHTDGKTKGRINYTVWSEVFGCPECGSEVVFLEQALDRETSRVRDSFPCPRCSSDLNKDNMQRLMETLIDPATQKPWQRVRFVPVLINYSVGGAKHDKKPDDPDRELLKRIASLQLPSSVPTDEFPIEQMYHGSRLAPKGFTRVHHLFLPRAIQALGALWSKASVVGEKRLRNMLIFFVEQAIWGMSMLNRYSPSHFSQTNRQLSGVYYVASQHSEVSPWYNLEGKLDRLVRTFQVIYSKNNFGIVTTGTAAVMGLPSHSIDYVFTDPPFGENIYYADLNFLVECWHRVKTDSAPEAIVDQPKGKGLLEYQHLMQRCFEEYYRVLKPGRWMTVVFHNSRNSVWNAIQEAMLAAKFVVADVRTLDKQQGSYRQVTSTAMKQDLVISAYKPDVALEERFNVQAGTVAGAWAFVRAHLGQLPVFVSKKGRVEVVAERLDHMLFDRMVAFHVLRNTTVPLSASEFFAGLGGQGFQLHDGMYFLEEQAAEYEKKKARLADQAVVQLELFVTNEESAILWLKQELREKPQDEQELQPKFLKEIRATSWEKHEQHLELRVLLTQNFLCYDGRGEVPSQIHAYLSSNFHSLRGLPKDAPALRGKAKDRWYVPDPSKAGDLEKLRERALLREFEEYRESKQKKLKVFRLEAVRAGFKKAWQERQYVTIIAVAQKIPEDVLQEDAKLLMWYDQALTRSEGS